MTVSMTSIQDTFKAPTEEVAASLFFKRFPLLADAFTTLVKTHEFMSPNLADYEVVIEPKSIVLNPKTPPTTRELTEQTRVLYVESLMAQTIKPLLQQMQAFISGDVLIAHLLHGMYHVYYCDDSFTEAQKEQLSRLIELMREQFVAAGYQIAVDYDVKLIAHPLTQKPVLLRNVCCLAYQIKNKKCRVCPRLSEEERLQLLKTPKTK